MWRTAFLPTLANMCEGQTAQSEIGKLKIDRSNTSRLMSKWVEAGILIRVGDEDTAASLPARKAQRKKRQEAP